MIFWTDFHQNRLGLLRFEDFICIIVFHEAHVTTATDTIYTNICSLMFFISFIWHKYCNLHIFYAIIYYMWIFSKTVEDNKLRPVASLDIVYLCSQTPLRLWLVITSSLTRVWSIAIRMSVCLSMCLHVSKTTCPNFTIFSVHVTCGRG